jgi:hypothetical protein
MCIWVVPQKDGPVDGIAVGTGGSESIVKQKTVVCFLRIYKKTDK